MKRRAFTLTELLVGMTIMLILAGVMTLNSGSIGRQTARREAERVAAYIKDRMLRADMTRSVVWFTVTKTEIKVETGGKTHAKAKLEMPKFKASGSCTYSKTSNLVYPEDIASNVSEYIKVPKHSSVTVGTGKGVCTITIHGEDGKTCNVIIGG